MSSCMGHLVLVLRKLTKPFEFRENNTEKGVYVEKTHISLH